MKDSTLAKIHKFGKIGYTIANIIFTLSIIVLIFTSLATLFFASIPDNLIKIDNISTQSITLNLEGIQEPIQINKDSLNILKEENISFPNIFNSIEYRFVDMKTNGEDLKMIGEYHQESKDINDFAMAFFIMLIGLSIEVILLYFIKKLFKNIKDCPSPFNDEIIDILSKISTTLIPLAIYYLLSDTLINAIVTDQFALFNNINISGFIIVAFVYIIISIFKYGAILQKEADETL